MDKEQFQINFKGEDRGMGEETTSVGELEW